MGLCVIAIVVLIGYPIYMKSIVPVTPGSTSYDPTPTSYDPTPTSYDPTEPTSYDPTPTSYDPTPTSYDPTPTSYDPTPTSYDPTEPTSYDPTPVDCVMSEWSAYKCDCETEKQTRTRRIITHDDAGGRACGELSQTEDCTYGICIPHESVGTAWIGNLDLKNKNWVDLDGPDTQSTYACKVKCKNTPGCGAIVFDPTGPSWGAPQCGGCLSRDCPFVTSQSDVTKYGKGYIRIDAKESVASRVYNLFTSLGTAMRAPKVNGAYVSLKKFTGGDNSLDLCQAACTQDPKCSQINMKDGICTLCQGAQLGQDCWTTSDLKGYRRNTTGSFSYLGPVETKSQYGQQNTYPTVSSLAGCKAACVDGCSGIRYSETYNACVVCDGDCLIKPNENAWRKNLDPTNFY